MYPPIFIVYFKKLYSKYWLQTLFSCFFIMRHFVIYEFLNIFF